MKKLLFILLISNAALAQDTVRLDTSAYKWVVGKRGKYIDWVIPPVTTHAGKHKDTTDHKAQGLMIVDTVLSYEGRILDTLTVTNVTGTNTQHWAYSPDTLLTTLSGYSFTTVGERYGFAQDFISFGFEDDPIYHIHGDTVKAIQHLCNKFNELIEENDELQKRYDAARELLGWVKMDQLVYLVDDANWRKKYKASLKRWYALTRNNINR